jgi:pyridinium-3,5-biscarboxylic acid mononucleotide sulfurtransferase
MPLTPQPSPSVRTSPPEPLALDKEQHLLHALRCLDSLLVAYSGGTDSAYLAWAAHRALGDRFLAVTALSSSFSAHDRSVASDLAAASGWSHQLIETDEFKNPLYVANGADRCFHCKDELFLKMEALAHVRGFSSIAYGVNVDDILDFRPGHRAAARHQVLTPLLDAGLTKSEIRALSRAAGLPTWDRPAAACLSSRVPHGTPVMPELLERIERAEDVLRQLGFRQFRVRAHDQLARIEIAPEEIPRIFSDFLAPAISSRLHHLGFLYVTLDLEGYRQGSLNALLPLLGDSQGDT